MWHPVRRGSGGGGVHAATGWWAGYPLYTDDSYPPGKEGGAALRAPGVAQEGERILFDVCRLTLPSTYGGCIV